MEDNTFNNSINTIDESCLNTHNNEYESGENFQFRKFEINQNKFPLKTEVSENRNWIAVTSHQPIDTITRYVDKVVKETKIVHKPKIEYVEKIKEVPKYIHKYDNKIINVPEHHFVDKNIIEPIVAEKLKYVPKEIIQYNNIKKPIIKNIEVEKHVNKLHVQERVKYETKEIIEEVYNHYDPIQNKFMNSDGNTIIFDNDMNMNASENEYNNNSENNTQNIDKLFEKPRYQYIDINNNNSMPPLLNALGPQISLPQNPIIEKVTIPKIEKVIELKKKINIPIDFPVPYIVPKPKIIDVKVPVFKFNDKYVPVPMKSKIIPKITWTDQIYQVDCIIEKPYLVYHDVIKIVPTNAKIIVKEYPKGISKINQNELTEVDNLALWMRVNADLKKKQNIESENEKKLENEKKQSIFCNTNCNNNSSRNVSSYSCICSETDISDDVNSTVDTDQNSSNNNNSNNNSSNNNSSNNNSVMNIGEVLPLHPGHPLNMIHLQNKWLTQDVSKIGNGNIYNQKFLNAHKNAVFNLQTNYPREVEVEAKQILALQERINNSNSNSNSNNHNMNNNQHQMNQINQMNQMNQMNNDSYIN